MNATNAYEKINTSLVLRSEEGENLLYVVEIEDQSIVYRCFASENYNQALAVAAKVFNKLKTKDVGDFAVIIESAHGRGVLYDINHFTYDPDFLDTEHFYRDLVNEFEYQKVASNLDYNTLFRQMVNKSKLNEYQERRFLSYLKELYSEKDRKYDE